MILYGTNPIAWSNDDDARIGANITLDQCLSDASNIGFDGIEKGNKFPADKEDLRAKLAQYGLQFVSGWHSTNLLIHSVAEETVAIQEHLDKLKYNGCKVCIVCETSNAIHGQDSVPMNDKPVLPKAAWAKFCADLEKIAEHCEKEGLTLVYHHHAGTIVETPEEIDLFMAHKGPKTKLLFDSGHCVVGGGNPAAILQKYIGEVRHFHAKNVRMPILIEVREQNLSFLEGVRRGMFTVPGDVEGITDFTPLLSELKRADYEGWIVIEAEQDPDIRGPYTYQDLGLKTLKSIATEVGLD